MKRFIWVIAALMCASSVVADPSPEVRQMMDTPATAFDVFLSDLSSEIENQFNDDKMIPEKHIHSFFDLAGQYVGNEELVEILSKGTFYTDNINYEYSDNLFIFDFVVIVQVSDSDLQKYSGIKKDASIVLAKAFKARIEFCLRNVDIRYGWESDDMNEAKFKDHFLSRIVVNASIYIVNDALNSPDSKVKEITAILDQHNHLSFRSLSGE